jgi:hypothetical protein
MNGDAAQMIETQDQFAAAFEKALQYLSHPPQRDTPQDEEFGRILLDLASYRHRLDEALLPEHPAAVAFAALDDELTAFRRRYPERVASGSMSHFGFGQDLTPPGA